MGGTRINSSRRRKTASANAAREDKWAAVMEKKNKVADAAMTAANAKMQDTMQKSSLQARNNQASMARQVMAGNQSMQQGVQRGQQQMNQIGARGLNQRNLATHQGGIVAGAAGQQNTWNKEAANRKFAADFIMRGGEGTPQVNNLYNNPGTSNVDVAGMQVPQKQIQPKQIYVQPKFDDDDDKIEGTGMWTSPPTAGGAMGGQPGGGRTVNIPAKKDLVPGEVYPTPQGDMLWNGYRFAPFEQ